MLVIKGSAEATILSTASKTTPMGEINKVLHENFESVSDYVGNDPKAVIYLSYVEFIGKPDFQRLIHFEDTIPSQIGIGLPPGSELRRCFDFHIMQMTQSGILHSILDKWLVRKPNDMSHRIFAKEAEPLGYDNLIFLAIIILVGCFLSLMLFLIEKCQCFKYR